MPVCTPVRLAATLAILLALLPAVARAEIAMLSEGWPDTDAGFARCQQRIRELHGRNLLARRGVQVFCRQNDVGDLPYLTDGDAGTRGNEGRVFVNGQPSEIAYYLGGLKTVKEIGLFTFNIDTRSNQDFEIRLADNSARPGKMPRFEGPADLTSGPTILGNNAGGFHTRFIDRKGGPLVARKVDWVQFRIWRTYDEKAGQPAKTRHPSSGSAYVEMEVLGEDHDVVVPTAAELARMDALRNAPRQPEYVKRQTWRETLVSDREALLVWEAVQDRLGLDAAEIDFSPWHVLGPIARNGKEDSSIQRQRQIDLGQHYAGKGGKSLVWQRRDDLKDCQLVDLTGFDGAGKDDVIYLCREVKCQRHFDRNQFYLTLGLSEGWIRWLPEGHSQDLHGQPYPNARLWELSGEPGACQFLVRLEAGHDGRRQLWFWPQVPRAQPGAGDASARAGRRLALLARVRKDFPGAAEQSQIDRETADGLWNCENHTLNDWTPGQSAAFLAEKYQAAIGRRLEDLKKQLGEETGVRAMALADLKDRLAAWAETFSKDLAAQPDPAALRQRYDQIASLEDLIALAGRVRSMRLSVEDQRETFRDRYPKSGEFLVRIAALEKQVNAAWERLLAVSPGGHAGSGELDLVLSLQKDIEAAGREILLANPVLAFDKLVIARGNVYFSSNWDGPNHIGDEICVLSPVRPDGQVTTIHKGSVSDMDLHWDGQRLLFSDGHFLHEMNVDGSGLRRITADDPPVTHYDGCYLPGGQICCVSNACEQAVPCTGGANVGNLHLLDADGKNERRVTFDQDHNWNPVVMNDGRVLYTRWEYTDLPHYFSRLLFRMNPDGTGQMEYYGSNSYWPNAKYWPRPIPGHPTEIVCVISGHHGVSRVGELILLDPQRGRHEADGVLQRIPGYGKKVTPVIEDQLVTHVWPKFAAPYPLAEPKTNRGAGKYFLVCVKDHEWSSWKLCLVDVFDNITPILEGGWMTPIPLVSRPMPPVIPSHYCPGRTDGLVYLADVYAGGGLKGYPPGSIKALRVGSHHYRFAGNGDTMASSFQGGWDCKKILGTVPVNPDGSVLFRVPANTPVFVQPLDAEGKAQQQMRSWYTAMPGETASCIGCHDQQNSGPPGRNSYAAQHPAVDIAPWHGPARGFSFDREVQPVLDRRCVGCHDGREHRVADSAATTIDLRAKRLHPDYAGDYSPAYLELQKYVRRPGYEADYHLAAPAEWEPDTSPLVQMLKKGHFGVELAGEEWDRLYTWIDLNVPYPANWRESHRPPQDVQVERRVKYKKLFANLDDHDEDPLPLPAIAAYEAPKPPAARPAKSLSAPNWPLAPEAAKALQAGAGLAASATLARSASEGATVTVTRSVSEGSVRHDSHTSDPRLRVGLVSSAGAVEKEIDLGEGLAMKFLLIPAGTFVMGDLAGFEDEWRQAVVTIPRPFYLGRFEVTNRQFAAFNPQHDSGYIDARGKDRTSRGYPVNGPDQPVVRVTWHEATAFCQWLARRTGLRATLPTEAQWEWACRAGTSTRWSFGEYLPGKTNFVANLADGSAQGWNYGRAEPGYQDGAQFSAAVGRYPPNAWGLCDMHGNAAEWTLSTYAPYPYNPADGRDDPKNPGPKVVRGGSWNDTLRYATSASRWRYAPYKPVYNVGFRVLLETADAVAAAEKK
jgi:formylglycine-generating enzyme required for sulfatase activity